MRGPASEDMTSVSVELCESEFCFLHIQLTGTNIRLRKYIDFFPRSILSLQDHQQSRNPETNLVRNAAQYFSYDRIVCNHSCCECKRSNEPGVCHALVHFVTARANF